MICVYGDCFLKGDTTFPVCILCLFCVHCVLVVLLLLQVWHVAILCIFDSSGVDCRVVVVHDANRILSHILVMIHMYICHRIRKYVPRQMISMDTNTWYICIYTVHLETCIRLIHVTTCSTSHQIEYSVGANSRELSREHSQRK